MLRAPRLCRPRCPATAARSRPPSSTRRYNHARRGLRWSWGPGRAPAHRPEHDPLLRTLAVPETGVEPALPVKATRPSTWRVCQFRHSGVVLRVRARDSRGFFHECHSAIDMQNFESVTLTLAHLDPLSALQAHSQILLDQRPKRTFLLR